MKNTHSSANSSCPTLEAFGGMVERRQHPRGGIVTRVEDITYSVLRQYELIGEAT
jgi:hypothetical protein